MTQEERLENDASSDEWFETTPENIRIDERNKTIDDVIVLINTQIGIEFELRKHLVDNVVTLKII